LCWARIIIVGAVRLGLPADLEHARWCEIGADFCHLKHALASWVGDLVGLRRASPRRTPEDHHRPWQGPAYQTCANAAALCRAFEIFCRPEVLSFSHHAAFAALTPAEQDGLLD
jgi:hypothetical protein